jgi:two-component system sensor histidine kinase BaeS
VKLGITARLFLAILATNAVIAVAVGVAERVSFDKGFREYMRERESDRLSGLANALATLWRTEGSFESLRGNEANWRRFARTQGELGGPRRPPPEFRGDPDGPPPFPRGEHPPGPPPFDMPALLDAQRQPIVGSGAVDAHALLRPVTVDGATVGYLVGVAMREPFTGAERQLAEQQTRASFVIGGLALLLAAGVGFFLARGVIAPVRRLAGATHRLAAGDYATRVDPARNDELGRLVADFNRLAQTLEANESMRRNFMADVSHELRTPLAVLRGELEALEDGIRTLTPERLRSLQAEVATLGKLVDDLYDLSLADVGALKLHKERVDLAALADVALTAFRDRLAARFISVETDLPGRPVTIEADADRLTQVMNNLFENCARYTSEGGRMCVALAEDAGSANLDVMDSAPGVPAESLPRLFDRLYRVDASRSRRGGGAGLGLALCRSIVEGHGGTVEAQPSPLGGLWVRVRLPA